MDSLKKEEVSQEVLIGIYRILSGLPYSFIDKIDVCNNFKPNMKESYKWINEWGKKNNIECKGDKQLI